MTVAESVKAAYAGVLRFMVENGRAPHYTELARQLEIDHETARVLLHETADAGPVAGCWLAHDTDLIESWAPFSNLPTDFRLSVDDRHGWFGQ